MQYSIVGHCRFASLVISMPAVIIICLSCECLTESGARGI